MKQPIKRKKRARTARRSHPLVGVRLKRVMRDALDEIALEWQVTRAHVMRELIAQALKSPPKKPARK